LTQKLKLPALPKFNLSSEDKKLAGAIRHIFGFSPSNINLYKQALRHKSAASEIRQGVKNSNERLEYLGDAVLSSVIATYLFKKFPYKEEGFLTEMRSKLVSRQRLNMICEKIGLDKLIQTGDSASVSQSIKGNAFESVVGAIYIDKGYDFTLKVIVKNIIISHLDIDEIEHEESNFKSRLLEWAQKEKKSLEYKIADIKDTSKNKIYYVEVYIDNAISGKGSGFSIKAAEQAAADNAMRKIQL
jgi:ribonuclease-3